MNKLDELKTMVDPMGFNKDKSCDWCGKLSVEADWHICGNCGDTFTNKPVDQKECLCADCQENENYAIKH